MIGEKYFDYYFGYGSNLNVKQMNKRCSLAIPYKKARMPNYKLKFNQGVLDVVKAEGREVIGGIYIIPKADIENLDRYEGYPYLYGRSRIRFKKEKLRAIIYYMKKDGKRRSINNKPTRYYYNTVKQGFKDWGIDTKFLETALQETYIKELKNRKECG